MSKNVFVYGTLMLPEIVKALTGKTFRSKSATLEGYKRYKIYDGEKARPYPAIRKTTGGCVDGVVLLDVDDESLDILDFFEDVGYVRQEKELLVDGDLLKVSFYAWPTKQPRNLSGMLKGRWGQAEIELFQEKFMEKYLKEIIPQTLVDYKKRVYEK